MIAIPNMSKPMNCMDCIVEAYADCDICKGMVSASKYADRRYEHCTLIDIVTCGECKHRDPEDKKCDCGMFERQGCIFPVADDYFCKYGERANNTQTDE